MTKFPRKLNDTELALLRFVLPAEKNGYKDIYDRITALWVIGLGRFGGNNFIIGEHNDSPDLTISTASVIAAGYKTIGLQRYYIVVHEEKDSQFEIDYQTVENGKDYSFSDWCPGSKAPGDGTDVRETIVLENKAVLAFAPAHKRIWLHDETTGINHFIPIANLYNEIMRLKNERDPKIALDSKRIFTHLNDFTDDEIRAGFLSYNSYLRKLTIDNSARNTSRKKKRRFLFSKQKRD